ncbi:MAG: hypothetical protein A3G32_05535 [Deltaproteobacteria bacterium RIFCSPLOWO2_12_FULL_40_28]|nr:MAG: hypothetical protein A3C45_03705 [Deltaproteobacteria bacterium RIFCSPHIGHO2_02_FULL_40_28]OGQ18930.1 MAG: hypothetical protein A3E27_09535 [Deltaproteobacteria bacterium RIFCSPHIGHO2_12_FULL_40_32]OGQ39473.1 MAG: hypothetical protein A3I69_09650 [Deltaproteobacteria bacterium RIFCSPLOWO2_02_FULL_40_36]OGQ53363.1 MAG: hypothetical protein A3G32_05535 [Deltaproteobacteria bacterium RIFCSPLOWO2_12_FULL_40_28]
MYKVVLTKQAENFFNLVMKSQPQMGLRISKVIDLLSEEPQCGVPLHGELKGLYKYRVGTYRIIYQISHSKLIITVIDK